MGVFYSWASSIQGRLLFKGVFYSRASSIQGRLLFKGVFYSRASSIQGRLLFKGVFHLLSLHIWCFLYFFLLCRCIADQKNSRISSIFMIPLYCKLKHLFNILSLEFLLRFQIVCSMWPPLKCTRVDLMGFYSGGGGVLFNKIQYPRFDVDLKNI